MFEIADEIVLDGEVALVDGRDERQLVHILENMARRIVADCTRGIAIRQTGDAMPIATLGNFPDREVELIAGDEVDRRRGGQASVRLDGDFGTYQAHFPARGG